jgi:hypothetical protein
MNTNTANGYYISNLAIDGVTQTTKWLGTKPTLGSQYATDVYNFNIVKTAANTYITLATVGAFK